MADNIEQIEPGLPGYLNAGYAASLAEFGTPRKLPHSDGWLLERDIPDSPHRDAMGCYPLFCCRKWTGLAQDIEGLWEDLISVALVADPFGEYSEADLKRAFDQRSEEHTS